MSDADPKVFKLDGADMLLYQSGMRRGHAECLRQMAEQLRNAAKENSVRAVVKNAEGEETSRDPTLDAVATGFEKFAAQLDMPAAEAAAEQQKLLDRFLAIRTRSVAERLKATMKGALGGWRGW